TELRDRLASIKLQLDVLDRSHDETAELAVKVFELSQTLKEQWLTADYATKRRLLEIVCLNSVLDGVTLCPEMRKPFDVLAEGLVSENSRGNRIRTCDLLTPRCVWSAANDRKTRVKMRFPILIRCINCVNCTLFGAGLVQKVQREIGGF